MKVALVYDRVNKWGGAERVLLQLQKLFPNAPLYTSVYNSQKAEWAKDFNIKSSFLQKIPFASSHHELLASVMPIAFENMSFDEYDVVISVTSEAAKGIITKPTTLHICYCLTPTRYLWSGYSEYFQNPILRFISRPIVEYLKKWDIVGAQRPDLLIAISKEVQKRIKKYYKRDSIVVYPPLDVHFQKTQNTQTVRKSDTSDNLKHRNAEFSESSESYFLVVSRLIDYKRIDIAIKACNQLNLPLKIVGSGASENELKNIAGSPVEFLGNLTDEELLIYYKNCRALIVPGLEDFGLTILEAQSFGKPVIAFRGGGALETVVDKKTGIFFSKQTTDSLVEALKQYFLLKFKKSDCVEQAEKFSEEKFKKQFMEEILKPLQTQDQRSLWDFVATQQVQNDNKII